MSVFAHGGYVIDRRGLWISHDYDRLTLVILVCSVTTTMHRCAKLALQTGASCGPVSLFLGVHSPISREEFDSHFKMTRSMFYHSLNEVLNPKKTYLPRSIARPAHSFCRAKRTISAYQSNSMESREIFTLSWHNTSFFIPSADLAKQKSGGWYTTSARQLFGEAYVAERTSGASK